MAAKRRARPGSHAFAARLERYPRGQFYVSVPAAVSRAIGKRGVVPIVAMVNAVAEVHASLVPCGGGRHRLHLNAETRDAARAALGDRVAIELSVDANPTADPIPPDLAHALEEAGVLAHFQGQRAGKQNHILRWVEQAAREATREKRIAFIVEHALRGQEEAADGASRRPSAAPPARKARPRARMVRNL